MKKQKKHRFIIGIGSQRAGSTLLHHLLDVSTDLFMHPVKELHYFDTLYGYRSAQALQDFSAKQIAREIDRIVTVKDSGFVKHKRYRCYLRTNKILSTTAIETVEYLDLFRPYLVEKATLGEVTPEYMLFNDESIIKMKGVIGEDAGIILICRNPVKRLLSAVKLMNSYNNLKLNDQAADIWLEQMLSHESGWICSQDAYNDFQGAIARYSMHFPNFLAISYDELTRQPKQTAEKISSALNLVIDSEVFERETQKTVNALGDNFKIREDLIESIKLRYSASQLFIDEYFGHLLIN